MQSWFCFLLLCSLQGIRGLSLSEFHSEQLFLAATLIGGDTCMWCSKAFTWISIVWFPAVWQSCMLLWFCWICGLVQYGYALILMARHVFWIKSWTVVCCTQILNCDFKLLFALLLCRWAWEPGQSWESGRQAHHLLCPFYSPAKPRKVGLSRDTGGRMHPPDGKGWEVEAAFMDASHT